MLPLFNQVSLIRYLIVWRVNGSLVQLPQCLATEISRTLATLIAERLPTQPARPWRKTVELWGNVPVAEEVIGDGEMSAEPVTPDTRAFADTTWPAWPIEAVVWTYPGKRTYGHGEPIVWELKLLGNDADHGLFLELLLPAMEAAAITSDERWHRPRTLWGRFDIDSIYVSRGPRWEPIARAGRLDLNVRVTPAQWAEGLDDPEQVAPRGRRLTWLTPFEFPGQQAAIESEVATADGLSPAEQQALSRAPSLGIILEALMSRIATLTLGKRGQAAQVWALLTAEERVALQEACAAGLTVKAELERAARACPGRWIGRQTFKQIAPILRPYLELAAIVHVGRHTHFGCGTFMFG